MAKQASPNQGGSKLEQATALQGRRFGVRKLADNLAMVVSQEGANPSGKGLVSHPYPNPEVD
jgi:hypothetical protein